GFWQLGQAEASASISCNAPRKSSAATSRSSTTCMRSFVSVRPKCAASRPPPATDLPLITMLERLQNRRPHRRNILAHPRQLAGARRFFRRVRPFGGLVDVRSQLAEFAEYPLQQVALGERALHRARP